MISSDRVSEQTFASLIENDCGISFSAYVTLINNSASGVAIYTGPTDTMRLAEHHIYGSSRIGVQTYAASEKNVWQENVGVLDSSMNRTVPWYGEGYGQLVNKDSLEPWGNGDGSTGYKAGRSVGLRYYELSDHLGNVLATVLDRKTGVKASSGDTVYSYWKADVATATDYYPFGMEMMGRTYSASIGLASKFGFNGQQRDDEVYGKGNLNTALFWEYDTRLARRWNIDPIGKPSLTSYHAFEDNPILFSDILGNTVEIRGKEAKNDTKKSSERSEEFATWIKDWDEDKTHTYVITTNPKDIKPFVKDFDETTGGTIASDGKATYYIYYNPENTGRLGASGVLEEAYHLNDALKGVDMSFSSTGECCANLDIWDEVRAKTWVANLKGMNSTYQFPYGDDVYILPSHYGYIKRLATQDDVANFLMNGSGPKVYSPEKGFNDVPTSNAPSGGNTKSASKSIYRSNGVFGGGGKYKNFSTEHKSKQP